MSAVTELSFTVSQIVFIVGHKHVEGKSLKAGQVIERFANHYKVLSGPEYSNGLYTYKVKQIKLKEYTYNGL